LGYTLHWERPKIISKSAFKAFSDDVRKMIQNAPPHSESAGGCFRDKPLIICGSDGAGEPEIGPEHVGFNGKAASEAGMGRVLTAEDMSHESFTISRVFTIPQWRAGERGLHYEFCKTERKPYDLIVVAALCALKHRCPRVKLAFDGKDARDVEDGYAHFVRTVTPDSIPPLSYFFPETTPVENLVAAAHAVEEAAIGNA
jgi:hypothetical protein